MSKVKNAVLAGAGLVAATWATGAAALPTPWGMSFQPAVTPVMERIENFHTELLWIITAICIVVLILLIIVVVKFNHRANPTPSKTHHNTILEIVWTIVPVIVLVFIAVPSFRLLYFEAGIPKPDVVVKAIGKQWFWTYEYPVQNFQFDSLGLSDEKDKAAGEPRLLGVDNVVVVPVNKVVEVDTAGADVIHS